MVYGSGFYIQEGMKASLLLRKDVVGSLKPGDKMKWVYAGDMLHDTYHLDQGKAIVVVTVVGNRWAGFGWRKVTFELSNISGFKSYQDLLKEARENIQKGGVLGMKIYEIDQRPLFVFDSGTKPIDGSNIPFPFEEELYKASWD